MLRTAIADVTEIVHYARIDDDPRPERRKTTYKLGTAKHRTGLQHILHMLETFKMQQSVRSEHKFLANVYLGSVECEILSLVL